MSAAPLDELDTRLLGAVQERVPLVERPYQAIAEKLGVSEAVVLERLAVLRTGERAKIRQISAIFDSKSLGYQSTLVAATVPVELLPQAVAAINAHPGVSHNYRRDHAWNVWFTLGVPPDSRLGLEKTADILQRRSGAKSMRLLPTIRMYKIGVRLALEEGAAPVVAAGAALKRQGGSVCEADKRLVRVLQRDLPLVGRPFDAWANEAGVNVAELLNAAARYCETGLMRRFSGVLRHRELGFDANAMGVWAVPDDQHDSFGATASGFAEVSHCYLRPSYPDWPYNIFTMIHARERAGGTAVLAAISAATGIRDYAALYSTQEYKKVRIRYFESDIPAWEEHLRCQSEGMLFCGMSFRFSVKGGGPGLLENVWDLPLTPVFTEGRELQMIVTCAACGESHDMSEEELKVPKGVQMACNHCGGSMVLMLPSHVETMPPQNGIVGGFEGPEAWEEGDLLVLLPCARLPDRCVKCNEPAEGYRWEETVGRVSVLHSLGIGVATAALTALAVACFGSFAVVVGGLVAGLVYRMVRTTARLSITLCPRHRAAMNRKLLGAKALLLLGGLTLCALPFLMMVPPNVLRNDLNGDLAGLSGILVLLLIIGAIVVGLSSRPVRVAKIIDGRVWLHGSGEAFRRSLAAETPLLLNAEDQVGPEG